MRLPLLALLTAASALLAGCTLPGTPADEADAPATQPPGPSFVLVLDNQLDRDIIAKLRVTGPSGGVDVEGNLTGAANETTRHEVPLAREGAHRLALEYSAIGGGFVAGGTTESAFDTSTCTGDTVVTIRFQSDDGRVLSGADAACRIAPPTP